MVVANVDDQVNTNVAFTVRGVAPEVPIIATANDPASADVLELAGATEVLVVADRGATASWLAADLISQAEHEEGAAAVLVTHAKGLVSRVQQQIAKQLEGLERMVETVRESGEPPPPELSQVRSKPRSPAMSRAMSYMATVPGWSGSQTGRRGQELDVVGSRSHK